MATVGQDRLNYLLAERSRRGVARDANISYYRLSQLALTGRALPTDQNKRLFNLYSNQTYGDFRGAGMSATQARRFAGGNIQTVNNTFDRMEAITEHLAGGALAKMSKSLIDKGFAVNYEELWVSALETLKEGLRNSDKSIEQWENY